MKQIATQELYRIWTALRGARKAPARGDVDPVQLAALLPNVFMLDIGPGLPARIRLAGTHMCAAFASELKGRFFDGLWRIEDRARINDLLDTLSEETAVVVLGASEEAHDASALHVELVLLPLSSGGIQVDGALGAFVARATSGRAPRRALLQLSLETQRISWPSGRPLTVDERMHAPVLAHARAKRQGHLLVYEGGRS